MPTTEQRLIELEDSIMALTSRASVLEYVAAAALWAALHDQADGNEMFSSIQSKFIKLLSEQPNEAFKESSLVAAERIFASVRNSFVADNDFVSGDN